MTGKKEYNPFDVVIIGSGLGGLLCGAILSREGKQVALLEKQPETGGALQVFRRDDVIFDTGIHYIGGMDENQPLNRYFRYVGLTGRLKLKRLNPDRFDVIGIGEKDYPIAQGFGNFREQLLPFFPGGESAFEKYTRSLQEIAASFPLYNLELPDEKHTEHKYRSQGAYAFFQTFSGTRHLPEVLAGNNFLYAGDAVKTPLHIPALINHLYISSAWQPVGGSHRIAEILAKEIRKNGGAVFTDHKVSRISRTGRDFILEAGNGRTFRSTVVISAIHPSNTIEIMDPQEFRPSFVQRIRQLGNTVSSFALYVVLKEKSFPQLDHNYYYHASEDVWSHPEGNGWPTGYLLYTPLHELNDTHARGLIILSTMNFSEVQQWAGDPERQGNGSYREFREQRAERLLGLVSAKFPSLRSCIASMDISTPLTWLQFTGTPGGSMYGIQKDFNRPEFTTVLPRTKLENFYFTGQNVNIHGVMGVTVGAVMTCGEILGLEYLLKKIRNG